MPISIRLPGDVEARLADLAARTGRSKTYYATEAIVGHIDDLEDLYLAEQRLADVRSGKSDTVAIEELMKRYGLKD
jgi:RHH-type rel operon transcriptional repressor/antitoxin RelB